MRVSPAAARFGCLLIGDGSLAVQVHRDLKASLTSGLTITDIHRFPTVAGLAAYLTIEAPPARSSVTWRPGAMRSRLAPDAA